MLSDYFGLVMDPFESGPDPRFIYMDGARRNAFAQLLSSVYECRGTVVLASERGLGKSTLIRHLADQLAALDSVLVLYPGGVLSCRPGMSFPAILAACRGRFDRRDKSGSDSDRLSATLERAASQSQVAALLLDDADTLDDVTLARLGQLSEPDGDDRRLVSVILCGAPGLAERLESIDGQDRRPSSVDLTVTLTPLRERDVDRLIRHRLSVAGHDGGELFSPVALAEIVRRSRGNPMRINALCSASLALAEKERKSTVSRDLVDRAAERVSDVDDDIAAPESSGPEEWAPGERDVGGSKRDGEGDGERARVLGIDELPFADKSSGTDKRLDDVAEAIRAADMRSAGGVDPHIKYGPYTPSGAGANEFVTRDRQAAAVRATGERIGESRKEHREDNRGQPHAAPVDDGYRVYPGVRPTGTQPRERRGGWAKVATIGIVLAALAGGAVYVVRAGVPSVDGVADEVRALVDKIVHSVEGLIEPDTALDEGSSLDKPLSGDGTGNAGTTDLGFERFGVVPQDKRAERDVPYDYAPPPPHGGAQPPAEPPAPAVAAVPEPAAAAKPDALPAPPPALQPAPPPAGAKPDAVAGSEPNAPEQAAAAAAAPAPPTAETRSEPGNLDLLDPATAVILSRRGPQPAPKPAPPTSANAAAQPARSAPQAAVKQADPPDKNSKPEADKAQVQPLLSRGDEYLGRGDLDMARTFYQMAYDRGSAEAAIRLGWTFDPQYFQRIGLRAEASPREAILWYQEALRRGSRQASERLSDLATWLQNAASAGDVEAKRILRMWQG